MTRHEKSKISPFWRQCFVTGAVCSNIIGHGCCIGFPAVLLPQLHQQDSTILLTKEHDSWIASVMCIALLVSNFIMPPIMGRLGRKVAHYSVAVPSIAGWGCFVIASNVELLIAGRVFQGLSVGMLFPLRSVLIGEYTSPKNRGAFLTTVSLAQAFGVFFVHLVGSLLTWHRTALICISFSVVSFIMTVYSPESPSWLAEKGRYDECREVFRWLRGADEDEELEEMIQARIILEKADIGRQKNYVGEKADLLTKREFIRPIVTMLCYYAMMHISGGTTMAAFSTQIIETIVDPKINSHFWMIALDTMRIIVNAVAIYVIHKIGRRTMTFATAGLSTVSHFAIAGYVFSKERGFLDVGGTWLPLLLINIQVFCVAAGMVPLPSVVAGEIFPLDYKSLGGGISLAFSALFMFAVLKTFQIMTDSVGYDGTFLVFACVMCVCLAIIAVLMPETKGKTLNQIEDELRGRPLRPDEIEARLSLQSDPVSAYIRKMSERTISMPALC